MLSIIHSIVHCSHLLCRWMREIIVVKKMKYFRFDQLHFFILFRFDHSFNFRFYFRLKIGPTTIKKLSQRNFTIEKCQRHFKWTNNSNGSISRVCVSDGNVSTIWINQIDKQRIERNSMKNWFPFVYILSLGLNRYVAELKRFPLSDTRFCFLSIQFSRIERPNEWPWPFPPRHFNDWTERKIGLNHLWKQ